MQRLIVAFAFFFSLLFSGLAHAEPPTVNEVKIELIKDLQAQGVLTPAAAASATASVLAKADQKTQEASDSTWTRWLSWVNMLYLAAVIAFLICFGGIIAKIAKGCWGLIILIPQAVYQGVFATAAGVGLVLPGLISASHPFYVALFSAFALPMIIGWVLTTYPKLALFVEKLFSLGIPPYVLAWLYSSAYFTVLALAYDSQIFGFFAAVSVSAALGFGLYYAPYWKAVILDIKEPMVGLVILSHSALIAAYVAAVQLGVPRIELFAAGVEYYCSIALGLALFIEISPFYKNIGFFKIVRAIAVIAGANFIYSYYGMHSIGAVIDLFAVLIVIDWIVYAAWSTGMIVGTGTTGLILLIAGWLIEKNGKAYLALFS